MDTCSPRREIFGFRAFGRRQVRGKYLRVRFGIPGVEFLPDEDNSSSVAVVGNGPEDERTKVNVCLAGRADGERSRKFGIGTRITLINMELIVGLSAKVKLI